MIIRFINIRFLLALASLQVAVMASADAYNYFYIDHQVLNQGNLGEEITIPVKAFFETPVTSWDVRFVFPEGITPVSIERGSEMTFDYDNGHQIYFSIAQNNDLTHFAASTTCMTKMTNINSGIVYSGKVATMKICFILLSESLPTSWTATSKLFLIRLMAMRMTRNQE